MASSAQPSPLPAQPRGDPYVLDPAKIQEPPRGWVPSLRFLGPGLITSAAIVGSGELITATTLGAEAGFVLLWLVFVSTLVKVAVQIELARWAISSGKPAIVVMVFGIQFTPFAYSAGDLASGMTFRIAAGNMGLALSMFGLTGVGALEITSYSFWCVEKGYAAWTGPNDGSMD